MNFQIHPRHYSKITDNFSNLDETTVQVILYYTHEAQFVRERMRYTVIQNLALNSL